MWSPNNYFICLDDRISYCHCLLILTTELAVVVSWKLKWTSQHLKSSSVIKGVQLTNCEDFHCKNCKMTFTTSIAAWVWKVNVAWMLRVIGRKSKSETLWRNCIWVSHLHIGWWTWNSIFWKVLWGRMSVWWTPTLAWSFVMFEVFGIPCMLSVLTLNITIFLKKNFKKYWQRLKENKI